jgi:CheY-like chemotaxis protein
MSKVLLVEDDNNLREIYEARLQAEGYDIVSAKDGEEALVVAKAEKPDLIISDVMMPKISGFEMLDILRNTDGLKDTKVIMLTALGQAEDQTRANSLGANRYLVKSQVTLEDIVKAASELLGGDAAPEAPAESAIAPTPVAATPAPSAPAVAAPAPEPVVAAPSAPVVPAPSAPEVPQAVEIPSAPVAETPAPEAPVELVTEPAPVTPEVSGETTAQEQATMEAQIQDFVNQSPSAEPAPVADTATATDDKLMTEAVNDLSTAAGTESTAESAPVPDAGPTVVAPTEPSPEVTPAPAPTAPAAPEVTSTQASDDTVGATHKKVIQPLNDIAKPDINQLLAQEEAKNIVAGAAPVTTAPPVVADANTNAPAAPVEAPAETSAAPAPAQPGNTVAPANGTGEPKVDGFDPNQVAL